MNDIKFKKLHQNAIIPTRANPTDFGADLVAVSRTITKHYIEYDTGIAIELPPGHAGFIMPRSSVSNTDLILANSIGLIDQTYHQSLKLRFKLCTSDELAKVYSVGDKIGQLVILPIPTPSFTEVDSFDQESLRGGFGSTDIKLGV